MCESSTKRTKKTLLLRRLLFILFSADLRDEALFRRLRHKTFFQRLGADVDAVNVAVGFHDLDFLQVHLEPALCLAGNLAADAALPFCDTAPDVRLASGRLLACKSTTTCHDEIPFSGGTAPFQCAPQSKIIPPV